MHVYEKQQTYVGARVSFSLLPCLTLKIGSLKRQLASVINDSVSVISWEEPGTAGSATENTLVLKDFCARCSGKNKILGICKEFIVSVHFSFQQTTFLFIHGQNETKPRKNAHTKGQNKVKRMTRRGKAWSWEE